MDTGQLPRDLVAMPMGGTMTGALSVVALLAAAGRGAVGGRAADDLCALVQCASLSRLDEAEAVAAELRRQLAAAEEEALAAVQAVNDTARRQCDVEIAAHEEQAAVAERRLTELHMKCDEEVAKLRRKAEEKKALGAPPEAPEEDPPAALPAPEAPSSLAPADEAACVPCPDRSTLSKPRMLSGVAKWTLDAPSSGPSPQRATRPRGAD